MNDFFANMYEFWGSAWIDGFSQDMYGNSLYPIIGWTMIAVSITTMIIFYKVIDNPRFYKIQHWLLSILVAAIINFTIAYSYSFNKLSLVYYTDGNLLPYDIEFTLLSIYNVIWTVLVCFIASMILKRFSVMARRTPF